jgi:hypothetical protein
MTEIAKLHAGYKLTAYPHRSLVLTAQDLLDVYEYVLLNANTLTREALAAKDEPPIGRDGIDQVESYRRILESGGTLDDPTGPAFA